MKKYFFDIDGVLSTDLFLVDGVIKPVVGNMTEHMQFAINNPDAYCHNCKPLKCVQDFVAAVANGNDIECYALTTDTNSFTLEAKKKFINTYYPEIKEVLFVSQDDDKITLMKSFAEKEHDNLEDYRLFEDTMSTIIKAQAEGITAWHITHIMLWSERNLAYQIF